MSKKGGSSKAEKEAETAALGDAGRKRIKRLFKAIENRLTFGPVLDPDVADEAKELAKKWKIGAKGRFDTAASRLTTPDLLLLLGGLVVELRPAYHFYEWMAKHHPEELAYWHYLRFKEEILPSIPKPLPKEKYDWKRRRTQSTGKIEQQFGGEPGLMSPYGIQLVAPPDCLDDIFARGAVNMRRLQELFGMDRHRLSENQDLPSVKEGRTRLYDYRAVVKIMGSLLSERPREGGKLARGKPREPWLNSPDLRTRVLDGIEKRVNETSAPKKVAEAFLSLVRKYGGHSGKK